MVDLLKALNNSKSTVEEEQKIRQKVVDKDIFMLNVVLLFSYFSISGGRLP